MTILFIFNIFFLIYLFVDCYSIKFDCVTTTASSYNHELSLINLIYSFNIHIKNCLLVVWNLGLSENILHILYNHSVYNKKLILFNFNYVEYPSYFNINIDAGKYAWKPIVIYITFHTYKLPLIWLDSGCNIEGSFDGIFRHIKKYKVWSEKGFHILKPYTHNGMAQFFNVNSTILNLRSCSLATVAFMYPSILSEKILSTWKKCSLTLSCISPNGSNLLNHRYDQSAFTIISYIAGVKRICENRGENNISIHYEYKPNFIRNKNKIIHKFNSVV